jgi:calcineurin-like phosphoesterase family protein
MSRVFVISDTHFGHKRICEFEGIARPFASVEEHDRELVARWNAVVKPKDTVWHLGDVFFGKDGHLVLAALNGLKKLVLGNHDHYPLAIYQQYFSKVFGAAEWGGCILTHVPVHPNQLEKRYRLNVHGHMHSKKLDDPRYVCVSAEHTGLAPVLMTGATVSSTESSNESI